MHPLRRAQNACDVPAGSCLGGQLGALRAADATRVAAGATPLYLVSRWAGGQPGALQARPRPTPPRPRPRRCRGGAAVGRCLPYDRLEEHGTQVAGLRKGASAVTQVAAGGLYFGLPVAGAGDSLVALSVVADGLQLVTNDSPGRIVSARVCAFAGASCGTVQALQQTGYLQASVQNTGALPADFTVVVRAALGHAPAPSLR